MKDGAIQRLINLAAGWADNGAGILGRFAAEAQAELDEIESEAPALPANAVTFGQIAEAIDGACNTASKFREYDLHSFLRELVRELRALEAKRGGGK